MKKILLNLFLPCIVGFLSISCADDDTMNRNGSEIFATWSLINYQCCLSPSENYNQSEILWTFSNNGELSIAINTKLDENSQIPFQNSTTVAYTKTETEITIDQLTYDYRIEESGDLILSDSPASDGPIIILRK